MGNVLLYMVSGDIYVIGLVGVFAAKGKADMKIYTRIFLVIIAVSIAIVMSGLAVGAYFLTNKIRSALEDNLLVAVDIADQYIIKELEVLKLKAANAAEDIDLLYSAGEHEGALEKISSSYVPEYVGFAVFDDKTLLDSWGETSVSSELVNEPFIRSAFAGNRVVSTTYNEPDGALVKYVAVPISDEFVLAAVLPGHYISGLASQFTWWETGHLFLSDEAGHIISNISPEWVETRTNFIDLAQVDDSFSELGATMERIVAGERGNAVFSVNDVPRMSAFRPLSSDTEAWNIGVIAPIPEGPLNDIPLTVFLMGIVMMTLSLAAAIFAAYMLKRPYEQVDELRRAAIIASKSKSSFLANMSHEIRTPMNAIIGMTDIAASTESPERKDYALGKIKDASKYLLGIINDILDMSKIEADKLELHPEVFVFEELLKKVVSINNFRIVEKHQKLAVFLDEKIPHKLVCDDQRLAQVITNLIGNAVKFTPEYGKISLQASLTKVEGDTCEIRFDIADSGVGISKEQQTRLFRSFEQAESSTTRNYGGTGLGLTITKSIVELMGGSIAVSSVLGEGSIFTFTVKVIKPYAEKDNILHSAYKSEKNLRLLIVDADVETRGYFCEIAARFDIPCDIATSGDDAIMLLESGSRYDICFIDWRLPVENKMELSRNIAKTGAVETVVLIISTLEWQDIEDEANINGIYKFIPKPVFPSTFIGCIDSHLGIDLMYEEQGTKVKEGGLFSGSRVLLVEDIEINREIVVSLLEPTLLEIDCAENGAEAIRMFNEDPDKYDLILMDVQMPEMDGYNATRAIRALDFEKAKTVPIIAMTASVFRDDVDACLEAGMNDHIGKPLNFDAVLYTLRQYLPDVEPTKISKKKKQKVKKITATQQEAG